MTKIIELTEEEWLDIKRLIKLADNFVEDVMPQIGGLCIQRFDEVNELCIGLSKWKRDHVN